MGSLNYKTVKGIKYAYYVRYEQGEKKEMYCGRADSAKAEQKALEFEIDEMQARRAEIGRQIDVLEHRLAECKSKLEAQVGKNKKKKTTKK